MYLDSIKNRPAANMSRDHAGLPSTVLLLPSVRRACVSTRAADIHYHSTSVCHRSDHSDAIHALNVFRSPNMSRDHAGLPSTIHKLPSLRRACVSTRGADIIQPSARNLNDHSDTDPPQRSSPNASAGGQLTYCQHQMQTYCQPYGASDPFTTYALPCYETFQCRHV